jgi:hypothetical protein
MILEYARSRQQIAVLRGCQLADRRQASANHARCRRTQFAAGRLLLLTYE